MSCYLTLYTVTLVISIYINVQNIVSIRYSRENKDGSRSASLLGISTSLHFHVALLDYGRLAPAGLQIDRAFGCLVCIRLLRMYVQASVGRLSTPYCISISTVVKNGSDASLHKLCLRIPFEISAIYFYLVRPVKPFALFIIYFHVKIFSPINTLPGMQ